MRYMAIGSTPPSWADPVGRCAMLQDDLTYYRRRAEVELEQAQRAEDPGVVKAHYDMASAYLDRVAGSEAMDPNADTSRIGKEVFM